MIARPRRSRSVVLTCLVAVMLAGCSAVAPPTTAGSSSAVDGTAAAGCGARSARQAVRSVPYESLEPAAGFTGAVAAARGRTVALGERVVSFRDFVRLVDPVTGPAKTSDGGVLGPSAAGLVGSGVRDTVLQLAPRTSTQAAGIPTTFPATNQLDVLRVRGDRVVLRDFTIRGTPQGHLYNGLRIDQSHGLQAAGLRVVGIPGDDLQPPGETFGINDYRTVGSLWSDVEIDGAGVGASGFGANSTRDVTLCRVRSHDNRFAMGFAFWQTRGIRLVDCSATRNGFAGFNFERVSGETVLVRPSARGNRYAMRIATDRTSGRYTIVDPQLTDGRWTVSLPKRWYGTRNRQRPEDIRLQVGGRLRPDLLRIVEY